VFVKCIIAQRLGGGEGALDDGTEAARGGRKTVAAAGAVAMMS
jgi:hypothetical protein